MPSSAASQPTLVLIDGSNVAQCSAWLSSLEPSLRADQGDVRRRLVDAVASWAGRAGVEALLVFDGAGPWRAGRTTVAPGIIVEGSGAGRSGDDLLEHAAAELRRSGRIHWLVTSDRALRGVAGTGADLVLGADEFVAGRLEEAIAESSEDRADGDPAPSGLGGLLDADTVARLDRLRRGAP